MKKVLGLHNAPRSHWVGDGFPVRSLFTYDSQAKNLSPFLLLDYAAPTQFAPAPRPRGVGQHPHRGFETVTIVYQGELEHRDSTGGGGVIGPGDVQWMTAASGILHDEFHSAAFTRGGGTLEMVQLWVNLKAADKMSPPRYQTLFNKDIPTVNLPDAAGSVRVIAGSYRGHRGPARTFTPMNVWDVRLNQDKSTRLSFDDGDTLALVVLRGSIRVNHAQSAREAQMVLLDRSGTDVQIDADSDATVLVLNGEPIDEPVVGHGPFVMNTKAEIERAIADFNSGKFGRMAS